MKFLLDEKLTKDSFFITDLTLSQVRLIDNANYPWVILVPKLPKIVEITDLSTEQYQLFNLEILAVANAMQHLFLPDKLNLATLGNQVSQLHYHVVVRYKDDECFPKPVWGQEQLAYDLSKADVLVDNIKNKLRLG